MRILFVGWRDKGHSSAGGYDKIAHYPGAKSLNRDSFPFGTIPLDTPLRGYRFALLARVLRKLSLYLLCTASHLLRWKYDVTHLYYGDYTWIPFWPYCRSKRHKVVVTLHLDARRYGKSEIRYLLKLDGVVVLSSEQAAFLKKEGVRATFIPHGFSVPSYSSSMPVDCEQRKLSTDSINVFVSGRMYRDNETLIFVIRRAEVATPNIVFHLVGVAEEVKLALKKMENSRVYARLSDDEYFSLLAACDYAFLPFTFATANNSLLEAQFCGITTILPQIGGVEDYAAPAPLNIFYENREALCAIMERLVKRPPQQAIRDFAARFEWKAVYRSLEDYYKLL